MKLFSKNSNLCDHNSPTLQTDRQTDGRTDRQTTCDRNTALCTKVHRAVSYFLKGPREPSSLRLEVFVEQVSSDRAEASVHEFYDGLTPYRRNADETDYTLPWKRNTCLQILCIIIFSHVDRMRDKCDAVSS